MNAIDYAIRTPAGAVQMGTVGSDGDGFVIPVDRGDQISINIKQENLRGYDRAGDDLLITLADGRVIVLDGYFGNGAPVSLYLSADGTLNSVQFVEAEGGILLAQYGPTETWGKWAPEDDLIFVEEPTVTSPSDYAMIANDVQPEEEVSMLATGLLGAGLAGGGGAAAAAAAGGAALLGASLLDGGSSGGGSGGGSSMITPTVDDVDVPREVYGDDTQTVVITGTAEPGSEVIVTIGEETVTTTATDEGTWEAEFTGDAFPADGNYEVDVTVNQPDGSSVDLDGPSVSIDVTAPAVEVESGTVSVSEIINGDGHAGGVVLSGQVEPGSTVVVTVGGTDFPATVDANGGWTVTIDENTLPGGEYDADIIITATDAAGNSTVITDTIRIDTETSLSFSSTAVEGDDIVNAAERSDGVSFSGTGEAGATVVVSILGVEHTTTVGANGAWSVTFAASDLPEGTQDITVTATSTDLAGNSATATDTFHLDTTTGLTVSTAGVEGDGVINNTERTDGVTLTGTAEPGSSVMVTFGSATRPAVVGANGSWSVDFPASEIPQGEQTVAVTAVSTDAAGNTATASGTVDVDTLVRNFAINGAPGGADGVINAAEASQGMSLSGTTEPGSTVMVSFNGVNRAATVASNGTWTVNFGAGEMPAGEGSYTLTAVATDAAGNVSTISQQVAVDTDAGRLTISAAPVEGDDVVNFAEAQDGVVLTGTSDPNQMVTVTLGGVSRNVMTNAQGIWTANFLSSEIPQGTYEAQITATITDAAGNTLTRTDSVSIDTEVQNFSVSTDPVEGDGIVNGVEASNGIVLTGSTEPGAAVTVTFEGVTRAANVDANGNWSVAFAAGEVPAGTYTTTAVINTTDMAGNSTQTTQTFQVDTLVDTLTGTNEFIAGDGVVNAAEAAQGLTLTGTVERGSTVQVTINGVTHTATVDANGNWSVDLASADIPRGTFDLPVLIEATDAAGNTRSITETLSIDTDAPNSPLVESYTRDHTGLRGVTIETTEDDVVVSHVTDAGTVEEVANMSFDLGEPLNETSYAFTQNVPDGSHLVITGTDDAGNTSGTYLVLDDTTTSEVTMTDALANTLGDYQIETIDLQFAEDSELTITEAQILALNSDTDTLTITGGVDDQITITGATAHGNDGEGFNIFTLGEATIRIEDDITQVVI
ncbi:MAG: Ig-like domain-containing protein [Pseudomonadota bacterium]|nr:Ig-like domain-containing protein [Pseudomonadota bacterium]